MARWLHSHGAIAVGLLLDNCFISMQFYGHCTGTVRQPCDSCVGVVRLSQEPTIIAQFSFCQNDHLKSCVVRTISVQSLCCGRVMLPTTYGFAIFQNLS